MGRVRRASHDLGAGAPPAPARNRHRRQNCIVASRRWCELGSSYSFTYLVEFIRIRHGGARMERRTTLERHGRCTGSDNWPKVTPTRHHVVWRFLCSKKRAFLFSGWCKRSCYFYLWENNVSGVNSLLGRRSKRCQRRRRNMIRYEMLL